MGTVKNKRQVLSVKGKVKVIRQTENGKRELTCIRNLVS